MKILTHSVLLVDLAGWLVGLNTFTNKNSYQMCTVCRERDK